MALHELPPDVAFQRIREDADKFSFTRSTVSYRSAIVGLGSLSGKAIQAVGEALLSGLDKLYYRGRLQLIGRQLRSYKGSEEIFPALYKVLFGYQRIGIYPEPVRQNAWSLICLLLEKGNTHIPHFADALLVDETEGRFFLQQLAVYKYSNWKANAVWDSSPELDRGVRSLLLLILQTKPSLIHEEPDITQFLYLCCEGDQAQGNQDQIMDNLWLINPTPSVEDQPLLPYFARNSCGSSLLLCTMWYLYIAPLELSSSSIHSSIQMVLDSFPSPHINIVFTEVHGMLMLRWRSSQLFLVLPT
ncbi:hypothetical protein QCA50_014059 [Cerrena zonata]|uniref:Uncharacterized protein n=1 Tax=Cerrena zonata TaxID=2478898 RepID=A0AAW0FPB5_9APHY